MKPFWKCAVLPFLLSWGVCPPEAAGQEVLMRVGSEDVTRAEYEYFRRQQQVPSHRDSLRENTEGFLRQLVALKLKARAAEQRKLDTLPALQAEWATYRKLLSRNYLLFGKDTPEPQRAAQKARAGNPAYARQIFIRLPQNASPSLLQTVQQRMDSISQALAHDKDGNLFDALARQYSDEKEVFAVRRLERPVEFEDTLFRLQPGAVSRPFYTPEGIHIVKRLKREARPQPGVCKPSPSSPRPDDRLMGQLIKKRVEELKKEYHYAPHQLGMKQLLAYGHTQERLFTLDGRAYTGKDFARFQASRPGGAKARLPEFIAHSVLAYEYARLGEKYPDYVWQGKLHRDSLLASTATRQAIGLPGEETPQALQAYFKKHRTDYRWDTRRYKGMVLHCVSKRVAKDVKRFLKRLPFGEWTKALRLAVNIGSVVAVSEQGLFAPGDNRYVDELVFKGKKVPRLPGYPVTVVLGKKLKKPETFHDVWPQVAADYRADLEERWLEQLASSLKVEINQEVLKTVNNHGLEP